MQLATLISGGNGQQRRAGTRIGGAMIHRSEEIRANCI
jgi:hypothetical protein